MNKSKIGAMALLFCAVGWTAPALSLGTALRESMAQGASAKIEAEKKVRAREFENEKRGMLWPTVAAYATAGRGAQPVDMSSYGGNGFDNVAGNQYAYGLQASGPIYTFGKVSTAIDMAEQQNVAVSSQVRRSLQEIQGKVLEAYASALLAEQKVQVLRRSRDRAKESFVLAERDFNAGKGMKSDLLLSKADIKSLEAEIIAAENTALLARQDLNRQLGRPADDRAELDTNLALEGLDGNAVSEEEAIKQALESRNDLKALQLSARIYEGTAKVFQANYYPTIAYNAKVGLTGSEPEHMVEWVHRTWNVGVGLNWTLFDGWASQGANRAAAAQYKSDARVYQYQAGELSRAVAMGVTSARNNVASADSALSAALEGRAAASEAVAFLQANYPGAALRLSDVQQGEQALRNAEFGVLAARISRTKALAELRLAMGQDLVSPPEE